MATISHTLELPYSAWQMYDLVHDVASYPMFVPGCVRSQILGQQGQDVLASLTFSYAGITYTLTTRNVCEPYGSIKMSLVKGAVRHLSGAWNFQEISPERCLVSIALDVEFIGWWNGLLSSKLHTVSERIVHAFQDRAKQVYLES